MCGYISTFWIILIILDGSIFMGFKRFIERSIFISYVKFLTKKYSIRFLSNIMLLQACRNIFLWLTHQIWPKMSHNGYWWIQNTSKYKSSVVAHDCTCSISVCNFTVGLSFACFPFNWMWQLCYEVSCGSDLWLGAFMKHIILNLLEYFIWLIITINIAC